MSNSKKWPATIVFIVLAAAAFVILYLIVGVQPEPPPAKEIIETVPAPAPAPVPAPEPEPEPEPETAKAPRPAPPPPSPPLKAIQVVKDDQPPPLEVTTPRDRSYVMARLLPVRARSEAGAQIELNGNPLKEITAGVFSGTTKLMPGENQLSFSASDAVGNRSSATLRVTYVEPKRIRRVKTRFTALLGQLEEVRSTAEDIDRRTEVIISRIEDMQNADTVNRLSKELREIRNARRDLQKEIEKAIREIDALLEKHQ